MVIVSAPSVSCSTSGAEHRRMIFPLVPKVVPNVASVPVLPTFCFRLGNPVVSYKACRTLSTFLR
jgi:hypothetical protein